MKLTIADDIFPDDDMQQLRDYRDKQRDHRLQRRFIALLMLAEGVLIEIVASVVGKSVKTIETWGANYRTKGIDSLNTGQSLHQGAVSGELFGRSRAGADAQTWLETDSSEDATGESSQRGRTAGVCGEL